MDRFLNYVSKIVFIFAVVCILFAVSILIYLKGSEMIYTQHNQICLPSENGKLKCGPTTQLLQEYLNKGISGRYVELRKGDRERQQEHLNKNKAHLLNTSDHLIWEGKPAAQLTGQKQDHVRKDEMDSEMVTVKKWSHDVRRNDGVDFLLNGICYRNGRLVIPVDGTYFLYSLLDFFESCDPTTCKPNIKDINKPIKHAIYKFSILEEAENEIISNVQPHQISSNKFYNSYSSYVSSIAVLKAGDEISVKVSNITYLRHVKDNSFGLYLI